MKKHENEWNLLCQNFANRVRFPGHDPFCQDTILFVAIARFHLFFSLSWQHCLVARKHGGITWNTRRLNIAAACCGRERCAGGRRATTNTPKNLLWTKKLGDTRYTHKPTHTHKHKTNTAGLGTHRTHIHSHTHRHTHSPGISNSNRHNTNTHSLTRAHTHLYTVTPARSENIQRERNGI